MAEQHSPHGRDSPTADADSEDISAKILGDGIGQDDDSASDAATAGSSSSPDVGSSLSPATGSSLSATTGSSLSAATGSSMSAGAGSSMPAVAGSSMPAVAGPDPLSGNRKRSRKSSAGGDDTEDDVVSPLGSGSVPSTSKRGPLLSCPSSESSSLDIVFSLPNPTPPENPDPESGEVPLVKIGRGKQLYVTVRITDILTLEESYVVRSCRPGVWDDGVIYTQELIKECLDADVKKEFDGTRYTYKILGGSKLRHDLPGNRVDLIIMSGTEPPPTGGENAHPDYARIAKDLISEWKKNYQVVHTLPDPPPPSGGP